MPRGDRTGPRGKGAMTGRAAGYCAGFGILPGYASAAARGFGRGGSRGCGFGGGGYGWRRWFDATGLPGWMRFGGYAEPYQKPDPELEKQSLKNQAEALQSELDLIKKRLDKLEAGAAST
jgi:hypothetical protein